MKVPGEVTLGDVEVGSARPPVIFAEIGINHEGSLDTAIQMASAAIKAGAKFIKHQTHIPEAEMSREAKLTIPGNAPDSIYEIMERCALSETDEKKLADFVRNAGAIFFSTPFSREAVDRLESLDVPFYKIGSGECNNYPFVDYVAQTGKPIVLSTGMNDLLSISRAVEILISRGVQFALLHTTNLYPTPSEYLRLGGLVALRQVFGDPVGLSDHSTSNAACLAGVALGASILERHFVDSKDRPGPDVICSMDPEDLERLLEESHSIFLARGGTKEMHPSEKITAEFAFSSVATLRDVRRGEVFTSENIFPVRPGTGEFGPEEYPLILGLRASRDIPLRTQLTNEMLDFPVRPRKTKTQ